MECYKVRKEIDRFVYQPDPVPGPEIYSHLDSCKACARYLNDTMQAASKIAALRLREPVLKNPEMLTEEIMNFIRENSTRNIFNSTEKSQKPRVINILQRVLVAATVCLFLAFGYEEYVVVNKISRLEKQIAAISKSSQYKTALNLKEALNIFLSDPGMQNWQDELKPGKINPMTLLKAAIYVDAIGINPDVLFLHDRTDDNTTNSMMISILRQFDSTHNNLLR